MIIVRIYKWFINQFFRFLTKFQLTFTAFTGIIKLLHNYFIESENTNEMA